ncbi:hypothetical protein [Acinetobacter seifertii]|uniref:Uncharacterized protein n=2 Tax=Acinetobacter calcoaceticus/baumannii complex TaxID=909768 RepID=A0A7H2PTB7_9GAMM|nr:hypothetical protein [Acinetobacter seifertii]QNX06100.1 hypothetical protein IC796_03935 [Acinetobacter seifertii]
MNLEQWQRSKKIKAEAEAAAKRTVERVLNTIKEPAMSEFKECTACNGRGEVGNVLDVDICQFCKGSGVELETLDHEENHISPNCKLIGE